MDAQVAAIYRHPVKGFTPEALARVDLAPGEGFPHDRIYAVETGPCGFDPAAPAFIPKQKFAVLAHLPQGAAIRTRYDEGSQELHAEAPDTPPFAGRLADPLGRETFEAWLTAQLGADARGPLKVVEAPPVHRFTDHPQGQVSVINLASVRDLGRLMGHEMDPLRFRANIYVEGWPAWVENDWPGGRLRLGAVEAEVFKTIVRCAATHVDPITAERDLDVTRALFDNFGHMNCGLYLKVDQAGAVAVGDLAAPL